MPISWFEVRPIKREYERFQTCTSISKAVQRSVNNISDHSELAIATNIINKNVIQRYNDQIPTSRAHLNVDSDFQGRGYTHRQVFTKFSYIHKLDRKSQLTMERTNSNSNENTINLIVTFHSLLTSLQRSLDLAFSEIPATIIQNIQKPLIRYRNSGNLNGMLQHMSPITTEGNGKTMDWTIDDCQKSEPGRPSVPSIGNK
ncbi:hypothetical protein GJ496_011688 [Pomphorhynchus laevis]|nr:hypothetical protein GJ496_011688 [Pomphorhynchus laevis]